MYRLNLWHCHSNTSANMAFTSNWYRWCLCNAYSWEIQALWRNIVIYSKIRKTFCRIWKLARYFKKFLQMLFLIKRFSENNTFYQWQQIMALFHIAQAWEVWLSRTQNYTNAGNGNDNVFIDRLFLPREIKIFCNFTCSSKNWIGAHL